MEFSFQELRQFELKMQYDGIARVLVREYEVRVAIVVVTIASSVLLCYFLVNGMNLTPTFAAVKNMIAAVVGAFRIMSSA
jgi:hypothetical protein